MLKEKNVKEILIIDDAEKSFISGTVDYFNSLGMECHSLTLSESNKEEANQLIKETSVIYLSGGNPYPLAKEIKHYKELISAKVYSSEEIVIGASAGAMVLGEEIYLAELLEPGSANGFIYEDSKGLNILSNRIVFPHCDEFEKPTEYENKANIIYIKKEEFYRIELFNL